MYEFHGWMGLAESTEEIDDGSLAARLLELSGWLAAIDWPTSSAHLEVHNGVSFFYVNGLVNRVRRETEEVYGLLTEVARLFPGAWGLFYERADEFPEPNAFHVRRLARGVWTQLEDPFLSPCNPTIED